MELIPSATPKVDHTGLDSISICTSIDHLYSALQHLLLYPYQLDYDTRWLEIARSTS